MSIVTDDDRTRIVREHVESIYRALVRGKGAIGPEELASQFYACLLAAAGMNLRAAGWRPWTEGGDELAAEMAAAAGEAMAAVVDRTIAARN